MKIVITEKQVVKLISEDAGVNRASITYSNIMLQKIVPVLDDFIKNKKTGITKLKIGLIDISEVWKGDLEGYIDFPISEIRIDVNKNIFPKTYEDEYSTGGGAEQIEEKSTDQSFLTTPPNSLPKYVKDEIDSAVNAKFEIDIYIREDFDITKRDGVISDLRDTILHETNHMLEFFKRSEKGLGYVDVSLGLSGSKNYNVPKDIFHIWQEFQTFVYFSEPHEMRAMVQEMYSLRMRLPFEEFKNHRYYIASKLMQEFDADTMFDVLVDKIESYNPDYLVPILTNLWKWFINDYYQITHVLKIEPNKKIDNTTNILDLMKVLQPRINKSGRTLQRNFNRLYSINVN